MIPAGCRVGHPVGGVVRSSRRESVTHVVGLKCYRCPRLDRAQRFRLPPSRTLPPSTFVPPSGAPGGSSRDATPLDVRPARPGSLGARPPLRRGSRPPRAVMRPSQAAALLDELGTGGRRNKDAATTPRAPRSPARQGGAARPCGLRYQPHASALHWILSDPALKATPRPGPPTWGTVRGVPCGGKRTGTARAGTTPTVAGTTPPRPPFAGHNRSP
jgi:hypothetical protein